MCNQLRVCRIAFNGALDARAVRTYKIELICILMHLFTQCRSRAINGIRSLNCIIFIASSV